MFVCFSKNIFFFQTNKHVKIEHSILIQITRFLWWHHKTQSIVEGKLREAQRSNLSLSSQVLQSAQHLQCKSVFIEVGHIHYLSLDIMLK